MPRGRLQKVDILTRVLKLKHDTLEGRYDCHGKEWVHGANDTLNRMLDMLNEYSN